MIALLGFALAVLAASFKSKSRLEAENAVLRHQLIILRRNMQGRVRLTDHDRWFFVVSSISTKAARHGRNVATCDRYMASALEPVLRAVAAHGRIHIQR